MALFKAVPIKQDLQNMFTYDGELGCLRWKISNSNRIKVGDVAGNVLKDGYTRIRINGVDYKAHRLIYHFF